MTLIEKHYGGRVLFPDQGWRPDNTPQTLIHILITDPSKLTHPPSQMAAFMHSFCGSEPNSRH